MDSGVEDPGEELSDLYDVSRLLSPAEALGVMDQLICHEVRHNSHIEWQTNMLIPSPDVLAPGLPTIADIVHQCLR